MKQKFNSLLQLIPNVVTVNIAIAALVLLVAVAFADPPAEGVPCNHYLPMTCADPCDVYQTGEGACCNTYNGSCCQRTCYYYQCYVDDPGNECINFAKTAYSTGQSIPLYCVGNKCVIYTE